MYKFFMLYCLAILSIGCAGARQIRVLNTRLTKPDTLTFFDSLRQRAVPVAFYGKPKPGQAIVIINHGYAGINGGYSYKGYSCMANYLAENGYYVVSIQHDLADDAPLPTTGNIYNTRKSFWERGVQNIYFVIAQLKKQNPKLNFKNITLIGHSNGGDMVMLFAHEHPELIRTAISLDNRRMPLPRISKPHICSIRSSDQPADADVLPSASDVKAYSISIVKLKHTIHNDMGDAGTEAQKREINRYVGQFLNGN